MPEKRPNFLVVMTDQQRGDSINLDPAGWTPRIAEWAGDAVNLTETHCPSPHCCPSRATFFTGLYPSRHGIWNNILNQHALSRDPKPGTRLWSEFLVEAGYDLNFAGKWHVACSTTPRDYGWKEHFVSAVEQRDHHGPKWEYYERIAREAESAEREPGWIKRPGYGDFRVYGSEADGGVRHDEHVCAHAESALRSLEGSDSPWMVYAGFIGPHDPYCVPGEWVDKIPEEACALPGNYADDLRDKPVIYQRMRDQIFGQLSPAEVRDARRHYLAYCAYEDHLFGRLLDTLRAIGAEDDTVVVFMSDHGDYAGEHGLFAKGIPCFRGAYHVPALVRHAGSGISGGRSTDALVSLADFGPTFLELAGVESPIEMTGRSLAPLLRGEVVADWRDALFTQCNGVELYYTQRSVVTREWRYTYNGFDRDELYDLRHDPQETRNLAADPDHAGRVRELCTRMWEFAHEQDDMLLSNYITVGLAPVGPAAGVPGRS